ncbi:MAG TPA: YihY/virulence factor BrkB family protein [Candidatus Dormibacteraeota bacterium]|nr:YihY/virulence factor BrkB family protein [Candidatus Dormibacteraeota bacterium]
MRRLSGMVWASLPLRVLRKFGDDGCGSHAVVIAWNGLVAIFPITLALAAIGGEVLSLAGVGRQAVYQLVLQVLPAGGGARDEALQAIEGVQESTGIFGLLALLGFFWTASGLFGSMEHAFQAVFDTPGRPFLRQKLMSLGMMGLFTVLVLVGVGTSLLLALLRQIGGIAEAPLQVPSGAEALQVAVGVVSGFVLFFAIYFVVPNRPQRPAQVWPGALLAGVAFELLTQLFPLYVRLNRGINQYGRSFALLFVLLAFFYFLGVITMLGAELNAVLHPSSGRQRDDRLAGEAGDGGEAAQTRGGGRPGRGAG